MAETEGAPATSSGSTGSGNLTVPPHGGERVPGDAVALDVSWLVSPDLAAVDVPARLHLVARRCGRTLWLHGATREPVQLLDLVGLRRILHISRRLNRSGDR